MVETIKSTLRDSKVARWTALAVVAFTMLCGYYLSDALSPLKPMLERELGWNSADFGVFRFSYGWLTVFAFMLIIGGILLDKLGVRFTGVAATITMVLGTAIKYWAISSDTFVGVQWDLILFEVNAQVMMVSIGYAVFCLGVEVAGITVSKIIVKWFKGKEMALAMGLEMATARLGTAAALFGAPILAESFQLSTPVLIGLIMLVIGFLAFCMYIFMDKKLDKSLKENGQWINDDEEAFKLSDIKFIIKNKGFWLLAILCVLFYSAVFPFLNYAGDLMVNKFGVSEKFAGAIPSLLPFGTIILTPFFGNLYDRKGKGATIMILGALLLIFVHAMFSIPVLNQQFVAVILIVILGIGFSLVPSAMWPSVPKIIPEKQLGSAYALIFWIQNIGLMFVPLIIGTVLNSSLCITGTRIVKGVAVTQYDYTVPMLIFTSLGLLAIVFAILLKAEDKKKGYGLQLPNIEKKEETV